MSDTQWPRFEVFQQDKPGQRHYNTGSVHAPDAEMALLNARDVFARRPRCHSMWVVPASGISAWTYQELVEGVRENGEFAAALPQPYAIFRKELNTRNTLEHVIYTGEVGAISPHDALEKAKHLFDDGMMVAVWWVVPVQAITCSDPADVNSLYAPALDKQYRQPNHYHTRTALETFRQQTQEEG